MTKSALTVKELLDKFSKKQFDICVEIEMLESILQVVAFSIEARRTLRGLHEVLPQFPEAEKAYREKVEDCNNWMTFDDKTAVVTQFVMDRMIRSSVALQELSDDLQSDIIEEMLHD